MYIQLNSLSVIELYEQIIYELKEAGDVETCHVLFKKAVQDLKQDFPERLAHLEYLIKKQGKLEVNLNIQNSDLYGC